MIVKSLWIGKALTRMENACIRSWLNVGYEFHLFCYNEVENVPDKCIVRNARDILHEDKIFQYNLPANKGGGSYSGFSNFFRYNLLKKEGGIWVDTDVYCVKKLLEIEYLFVEEFNIIASCIIKSPIDSLFARYCSDVCDSKNSSSISWGETGPLLVTDAISKFDLHNYVQKSNLYFPIMYNEIEEFLKDRQIPDVYTIHFWNEMWRRKGQNKDAVYSPNTLYERLIKRSICPRIF